MPQTVHHPVLLREVLDSIAPQVGERYLDLTAGYGGHAKAILDITHSTAVLVDRDNTAIDQLRTVFSDDSVELRYQDYLTASQEMLAEEKSFDIILADLGMSSPHLDNASRGFAILQDGPLDMRMDRRQQLRAYDVVNGYSEDDLIRIFTEYGEEPKARRIARLILQHRPIERTTELASIVQQAWPIGSRHHPATRTFQAIRIEVNQELQQLEQSLPIWLRLLASGGRLAVISFHSIEDGIVKRFFQEHAGERYDAELHILTKRPITASQHEIVTNPRARSARLRVSTRK